MPEFGDTSIKRLSQVDDRLKELFEEVVRHYDCHIMCGMRTTEEQQELFALGRSKPGRIVTYVDGVNKKSSHQFGRAVDVAPWFEEVPHIRWDNEKDWFHFAGFVKGVAALKGIPVIWGGDWDSDFDLEDQRFNDWPHWEITQ